MDGIISRSENKVVLYYIFRGWIRFFRKKRNMYQKCVFLLKGQYYPFPFLSTPNSGTYIPNSPKSKIKSLPSHPSMLNKADNPSSTPNPCTYIPSSPRLKKKSPPSHPSMLNKANDPPSTPNPDTYIPNLPR
jgi:hypothetical protein